jgi:hypothetical protein
MSAVTALTVVPAERNKVLWLSLSAGYMRVVREAYVGLYVAGCNGLEYKYFSAVRASADGHEI